MSSEEKMAKTPQDQLLVNWFFNSEPPYLDNYLKEAAQLGISKEEAEKLLDDWEAKGWMRRATDWFEASLVHATENLFLVFAERYTIEQIRKEAGRRDTKRSLTINGERIEIQTLVDILGAYVTVKNGHPDEEMLTSLQDKVDGFSGHGFRKAFAPLLKVWAKDPDYQIMFWILSERVLESWVHDETDRWFSLNECRRFFIDLPPEKIDMLKACASDAAGLRLYALRNEFWLSPDPWAYVDTMPEEDWPYTVLLAARALVLEKDPSYALKLANYALEETCETLGLPEFTANWFYGLILYANRDSAQVLDAMRSIVRSELSDESRLPLYIWCWFALEMDVCLLLEKAEKQFDCQWFYPEVRSLMAMTLFNRGIHDHPWAVELKERCDKGELPGLLGFEALHLLKPDSDEYKARAKAYGFPGLLPDNAPEMPAWERMLDRWINAEKETKAKIESSARTASLSRIVYRLDCDNWSLKPRLQKSKDGRTWSKGRDVALPSFKSGVVGMTKQDWAVAAYVQEVWGGMELKGVSVLDKLVGHPDVFDAKTNERLEIVRQDYALKVLRTADGFAVDDNLDSTFTQKGDYAVRNRGGKIVLMSLRSDVLTIAEDLKGVPCFPKTAADKLKTLLGSLSGRAVVMSDLGNENIETVVGRSIPTVRFELSDDNRFWAKLCVHPVKGEALSCAPGEGLEFLQTRIKEKSVQVRRDLKAEKAAARKVAKAMPVEAFNAHATEWSLSSLECLSALEALRQLGKAVEVEWPEDALYTVKDAPINMDALSLSVTSMDRWFTVEGTVRVNSKLKLKIAELLEKLSASTMPGFIELSDGRFVAVTESLRRLLGLVEGLSQKKRGKVTMPVYSGAVLDELEAAGVSVDADEAARTLIGRIREAADVVEPVPEQLQADLREYQVEGFRWMSRLAHWGAGGILADDMGLGKTVQAIAFLLSRAKHGASLVVMPTSVLLNWEREIKRFAPSLRPVIFNREDRAEVVKTLGAGDVLLSTYGLLPNEIENLKTVDWNVIVLDEAHTIKSKETKTSKAAMELTSDARLLLTGTPLQNHLSELWNLSEFANPGLLGGYTSFVERFVVPVEKLHDKERQRLLKRMISPFLLRRTKTDVLEELPEKTDITLRVELSHPERALYEGLRESTAKALETGEIKPMEALAALMKLRQAACHPQLVNPKLTMGSSKTDAFLELVDELRSNGHRALVFSQFTSHLALIKKALDERGIEYLYLDGAVSAAQRTKLTESFRLGSMPLFLISLKAGGTGLNLTAADYVIHLDPWWNPAIEDQASDRAYRIGQERPVTVYRLVAEGTIEEKILRLHDTKRSLADALLEGADMSSRLSKEELLKLLSDQG